MDRLGTSLLVTSLALVVGVSDAAGQDRAVVERLVELGRMPRRDAVDAVRTVDRVLAQNAESGGTRYDPIRQAVGRVMFQHPGRTREVYAQRLEAVIARMRAGLDEELLAALFPNEPNSAVMCADRFGATIQECDALIAASARERAALPYTAPDDGRALQQALRSSRVPSRVAREVASKLREVMVGVPRILSRDARGQAILRLLEACPGALTQRESQIRAWHVGPTEGMARCLAQKIAHRSSADQARERAELVFGMSPAAAAAFVSWGAPDAAPAPVVASPAPAPSPRAAPPSPAAPDQGAAQRWLQQAREHFSARRYAQAAAAYEEATRASPDEAGAWAGLGAAKMALRDAGAAAEAYQHAVRLEPGNAGYWTWLARAQARANDRAGALNSLRRALSIDPNNQTARQGLQAMGGAPPAPAPTPPRAPAPSAPPAPAPPGSPPAGPPPAQLPEVPDRQAIISVMRPLQGQVASCHPSYDGRVSFHVTVVGESGTVSQAAVEGELAGTPEAECMLNVIRGARFPRFSRDTLEIAYPYAL